MCIFETSNNDKQHFVYQVGRLSDPQGPKLWLAFILFFLSPLLTIQI
jgi:hypothetical protein